MICELCGKEIEDIYKVDIEGSELNVCRDCSRFGKVIARKVMQSEKSKKEEAKQKKKITKPAEPEIVEKLVDNFSELIRKARGKSGMNQQDFSKRLSIKESMLHKIETGEFKPSIVLARKIEKILKIKLVEEMEEKEVHLLGKPDKTAFTIGDFIKIKEK